MVLEKEEFIRKVKAREVTRKSIGRRSTKDDNVGKYHKVLDQSLARESSARGVAGTLLYPN